MVEVLRCISHFAGGAKDGPATIIGVHGRRSRTVGVPAIPPSASASAAADGSVVASQPRRIAGPRGGIGGSLTDHRVAVCASVSGGWDRTAERDRLGHAPQRTAVAPGVVGGRVSRTSAAHGGRSGGTDRNADGP